MNTTDPSPTTAAAQVVEKLAQLFNAGDREAALDLLHPDFRIQQPESLPHGGWHDGRDGMTRMGATFGRYWDRTISNSRILGCGRSAVQVCVVNWTAKDTGRSATVDVVELFSVTDGLIAEIRVFQQDTHLLLETLTSQP
jgi:uncharacterized protein